ncbi:MAG: DUF1573 domain-containing protein, partial [Muribaculaceae bacterium]|nr:DUF1573 domain-containing protein [Muribaculaceae bacterium]
EEDGPKKGSVKFLNTGPDPIAVSGARPSCGCTSVDFSDEPVAPGDTAVISFTYDPLGRPGKFDKSIRVYIGENDSYKIGIVGNVLGTPESLTQFYPYEVGPLRLSDLRLNAGEMTAGNSRNFFIRAYNQTLDSVSPAWVCSDPALTVSCSEKKIGPGDIAVFALFFNSGAVKEMGDTEIPITIIPDSADKNSPTQQIDFVAKVTPDFSKWTPDQVNNGPRCYLIPDKLDVGILLGDGSKTLCTLIQNQGKSKMNVLRIVPKSDAISVKKKPSVIKPSKTEEVKLSIIPKKLPEGPFNIPVEILTDDPLHPIRILSIVGIKE